MKKKLFYIIPTLIFLNIFLQSCATTGKVGEQSSITEAYYIILVANQTYESTMQTLAQAYQVGKLDDTDKVMILNIAHSFLLARDEAVETTTNYKKAIDAWKQGSTEKITLDELNKNVQTANETMTKALHEMEIQLGILTSYMIPR